MKQMLNINYLIGICFSCLLFVSCTKQKDYKLSKSSDNPAIKTIDPGMAPSNELLTVTGTGLGDIQSIIFDSGHVRASFNPVFNTDNTIMFRVPLEANPGDQHIIFTNGLGKQITVPFKVLGLPTIISVSNYDYNAGDQITLTGKNLDDVTNVLLHGTTDSAKIISATPTTLVIQMPVSTASRNTLDITNRAGVKTTTQEFINLDNAYGVFKDAWDTTIQDWSWGLTNAPSSSNVMNGTSSVQAAYSGSWGGMQLHFNTPVDITPYKYVSFWIKGGATDKVLDFYMNWAGQQKVQVPANVWTYYKFDLNSFKAAGVSSLATWIMQIEGNGDTFYMDDIVLSK